MLDTICNKNLYNFIKTKICKKYKLLELNRTSLLPYDFKELTGKEI